MRIASGKYNHVFVDTNTDKYGYELKGKVPCSGKNFNTEFEAAKDMTDHVRKELGLEPSKAFNKGETN